MASVIQDDPGTAGYYDPEKNTYGDNYKISETTPTYVRHDFIKKVFSIVFLQLLFTFGFMLMCYFVLPIKNFFIKHWYMATIGIVIFIATLIITAFFPQTTRSKTGSITVLCIVTPSMTLCLTSLSCHFKSYELAIAAGVTTFVVFALIIFAMQTKYDFTGWLTHIVVVSCVFSLFLIIGFFIRSRILGLVFAAIGTALTCIYIVFDVQMIMGGSHKYEFTIDDYAFASICLYTDIVTFFMDILRLMR